MESSSGVAREQARWTGAVFARMREARVNGVCTIGVLPGEGIGPEVIRAALGLLPAIERADGLASNFASVARSAETPSD